mmetsp:Transcript_32807/g.29675  ORF Transcript_32807/g.29675 Transcript_32807/m.29675 type:complete len:164 (+) Transcript_32807:64-555(+)
MDKDKVNKKDDLNNKVNPKDQEVKNAQDDKEVSAPVNAKRKSSQPDHELGVPDPTKKIQTQPALPNIEKYENWSDEEQKKWEANPFQIAKKLTEQLERDLKDPKISKAQIKATNYSIPTHVVAQMKSFIENPETQDYDLMVQLMGPQKAKEDYEKGITPSNIQ